MLSDNSYPLDFFFYHFISLNITTSLALIFFSLSTFLLFPIVPKAEKGKKRSSKNFAALQRYYNYFYVYFQQTASSLTNKNRISIFSFYNLNYPKTFSKFTLNFQLNWSILWINHLIIWMIALLAILARCLK